MAQKQQRNKQIDGVFYEYLPQTYTPPVNQNFVVEIEKQQPGTYRKLFTYLVIAAVILLIQLGVFYLLLKSAGQL